jgi:hypothetical protein
MYPMANYSAYKRIKGWFLAGVTTLCRWTLSRMTLLSAACHCADCRSFVCRGALGGLPTSFLDKHSSLFAKGRVSYIELTSGVSS